ncbi:U4/U6 x U5 tri-snRNP complex subunit Prp1 [Sporothrix eucalyptigena]|uniref:U4/U6 x U5 tri-snRNP complex subunit Prp1 n=1 Tax=Sporothrix eucalyptigena TaxID=1812306 RepID=A0ABP0BM62_9PEZI
MGLPDFLNQKPPENYVAGVGRGATSFVTRSDLGPSHDGPTDEQMKAAIAKRSLQLQNKANGRDSKDDEKDDGADDDRYQDPDNEVGLFSGGIYEKDDEEADRIWQEVDEKMARRRQKQRETREQAELEEYERRNPTVKAQFADLKRSLGTVSEEEWQNLPDVKDMTGRMKREREARRQRFYAVPDSVLAAARDGSELGTTVSDDGMASEANGGNKDGTMTNFAKIGAARDKVLQARLDQASHQTSGTSTVLGTSTSVDPRGYITSLNKLESAEKVSVSDVDFARKLLKSAVESNPTSAPGWIAAARVEELAGKIVAARNVIARGCQHCPKSEDVWLENIRLNENRNAKIIAADAIKANRRSVRLWIEAMKLETDPLSKKRVVRQALDHLPESEALWKEAVNLEEDPEDARLLLAKATELIPASIDLWLALARLETPKNAKAVLNKARKAVPTSHEIWIAAARLQEQLGEGNRGNVMKSAVQSLAKESAMPKREEWIGEAEKCEEEGAVITCGNIIRETLGWGLDEDDDRKDTWKEDARDSINRGRYETARAIYAYALRVFVNSKTLWLAAVDLERNHGTKDALFQVLERAVEACPHSEVLWMMLAKERLLAGELDEARRILGRAFKQNPNNEDIWLAAVKLEAENGFPDQARQLLATARQNAPTDRVWMRSVAFERQLSNDDAALELVQEALQLFPSAAKLWMMKGQIYEHLGKVPQAREAYSTGVKAVPGSVPLWLLFARLEERSGAVVKARSVLDRARQAVPKSPELWCELVRIERRAGNMAQAKALMAAALKQMPKSGLLWSERIWFLEPRTQRKPLSLEAIKQVDNDPQLFVAVARIFWGERKLERAQNWFEKALVLDADIGDSWAWYYKFLLQHGTAEKRADVISKCVMNDPRHGEHWQAIAKDPKNASKSVEEILKLVAADLS